MDDTLRNLAIGLFALLGLHGALHERVQRSAQRQVREAFAGQGTLHVEVAPRGFFGLEANDIYEVDVNGRGLRSDRLPFYVFPRGGWKGRIHHLRLHFTDLTLHGLHVQDFRADIPNAGYDLGHAFYRSRLVLRGTGIGPAQVRVSGPDLRDFIMSKYKLILSDVEVDFVTHLIRVQGTQVLFGRGRFQAMGSLTVRDGRFLDLDSDHTALQLSGRPIEGPLKNSILKTINPVLDIDTDLGLGGYFILDRVEIEDTYLSIYGRATVPVAPPGTHTP